MRTAAGLLAPPVPSQPQRLSGRVDVPARRGAAVRARQLPDRFTVPGTRMYLPEPGRRRHGENDAWFETADQDRDRVREELLAFTAWVERTAHRTSAAGAA